ncbi:DUF397 domain-containing protein [Actinacidiphila glaucinigra]|uniref:DUF397 domain-containing protein n=1 Tax=Actinacidiphila glaucinigra TaxID=235986 RepID=UPI0036E6BF47
MAALTGRPAERPQPRSSPDSDALGHRRPRCGLQARKPGASVEMEHTTERQSERAMQARKVDLYARNLTQAQWVKSSACPYGYRPHCVEVAHLGEGAVAIRDSAHRDLPPLRFTAEEWAAFRDGVREGEFG